MRFFNHLNLKVLALLSAVLLWFVVITVENNVIKYPGELPVKVVGLSDNYALSATLPQATLYLKMDSTELKDISPNDIEVFVNLSDFAEGTHTVDVEAEINGVRSKVLKLEPARITVQLSAIVTKEIPVTLLINGTPNKDYLIKNKEFIPEKVKVRGARSVLDQIKELSAGFTFTGQETSDISAEIPVTAQNLDTPDLISFDPQKVTVSIELESVNVEKELPIKLKFIRGEDEDQFLSKITIDPTTVKIKGEGAIIDSLKQIETMPIEISVLLRNESMQAKLNLPDGVTLVDSNEKITIKL